MPLPLRMLILTWIICCAGSISSQSNEETTGNLTKLITDLLKREDSEPAVKIETRNLTLVHGYNDTEALVANETMISGYNLNGGLLNNIENEGGIQKAVVVNNVHYSFYFWLMPKNYTAGNSRKR